MSKNPQPRPTGGAEGRSEGKKGRSRLVLELKAGKKGRILRQKVAISRGLCLLISTWDRLIMLFILLYLAA